MLWSCKIVTLITSLEQLPSLSLEVVVRKPVKIKLCKNTRNISHNSAIVIVFISGKCFKISILCFVDDMDAVVCSDLVKFDPENCLI